MTSNHRHEPVRNNAPFLGETEARARPIIEPLRFGKIQQQKVFSVRPIWQGNTPGDTNGCGTACLAMVFNALANRKSKASIKAKLPFTRQKLDYRRPFDLYSSPASLVKIAKEEGFYAASYHHVGFEDIKRHLDQGHLMLALHNPAPEERFGPLHYGVIHGYRDDPDPANRMLTFTDPSIRNSDLAKKTLRFDDFGQHWNHLKLAGIPIRVNCFMIAISNRDDLPRKTKVPLTLRLANGLHHAIYRYAKARALFFNRRS